MVPMRRLNLFTTSCQVDFKVSAFLKTGKLENPKKKTRGVRMRTGSRIEPDHRGARWMFPPPYRTCSPFMTQEANDSRMKKGL